MTRLAWACAALILTGGSSFAQSQTPGGMPPPAGMSLANSAAMRFPQPVRVGDLLDRDVLEPVESQTVLGTVGMVLLGQDMEVVAFTPRQLREFPTFSAGDATPVPADTIIKVGLAKPSH
ncbi:MAG: hypothetical protein ABSC06_29360 [Rhodopila sp.]